MKEISQQLLIVETIIIRNRLFNVSLNIPVDNLFTYVKLSPIHQTGMIKDINELNSIYDSYGYATNLFNIVSIESIIDVNFPINNKGIECPPLKIQEKPLYEQLEE